jgi:hypothetical protein
MNPHVEILFHRKNHLIVDASDGSIVFEGKDFKGNSSINAAKRKSRALQAKNHPFCVKVVDKLIKIDSGDKS